MRNKQARRDNRNELKVDNELKIYFYFISLHAICIYIFVLLLLENQANENEICLFASLVELSTSANTWCNKGPNV